jgi:ABC-2 type transport system permease protein
MGKTGLIIKREYITRVRKPSFIVMSILGPLLIACTFIIPLLIKQSNFKTTYVQVVDYTHQIAPVIKYYNSDHVIYLTTYADQNHSLVADRFQDSDDTAVVLIPEKFMENAAVTVMHKNHPGLNTMTKLKKDLQDLRVKWAVKQGTNINLVALDKQLHDVTVNYYNEGTSIEVQMIIGLIAGILMYMLIMIYGAQVMRGVMEEKTNRVVEIIISSVKPLQLLYGKIIGVALTGLTQFVILIVFMLTIFIAAKSYFITSSVEKAQQQLSSLQTLGQSDLPNQVVWGNELEKSNEISEQEMILYIDELKSILPKMLLFFPLFFLGGYLLYSSFFASIGAAVDSETETQQFVLPVTLPIIAAIIIATNIYENPNGDLAFWTSIIPITSPVVMLARLPFMDLSSQWWEVLLSLVLLIAAFILSTRLASKIYRTGILMYGQKASYKTIFKWLKYKN